MRTVVLHIGMHKTATTTIQHVLSTLDHSNITYGSLPEVNHSSAFYTLFSKNYLNYHVWKKRGLNPKQINELKLLYQSKLSNQLSDNTEKKIIFSAESIGLLEDSEKKDMISFFNRINVRLNIICYVRDPVTFGYSIFQEDIKSGSINIKSSYNPRYIYRLEEFNNNPLINSLIVRDYCNLKNGNIISDFFNVLDIDKNTPCHFKANQRLSISALKLIFLVNKFTRNHQWSQNLYEARLLFNNLIQNLYNHDKRDYQNYFKLNVDNSEINYLSKNFNIVYDYCSNGYSSSCSTILQWLEDLSDIDPVHLINYAKDQNIPYTNQQIDIIVMEIFNHYLGKM